MNLKKIVLHQIIRVGNETPTLNLSTLLLNEEESMVIDFMERINKSFTSKSPTYGRFEVDKEVYPFQKRVKEFGRTQDFLDFSIKSMSILKDRIKVSQATGGYVLFALYEDSDTDFLTIIMLDKSSQFSINDNDLNIKELETLAIDKLARASRLNISRWNSAIASNNETITYLAFIKGTREVSNYFQKFIGSTDLTSAKVNSKRLKHSVDDFLRANGYSTKQIFSINDAIYNYMDSQKGKREDVKLDAISAIIAPEKPTAFKDYVVENKLEVSGSFRISRTDEFRGFIRATLSGDGFKLEFDQKLKSDKIIREGNNIIIKDVPEHILNEEFSR